MQTRKFWLALLPLALACSHSAAPAGSPHPPGNTSSSAAPVPGDCPAPALFCDGFEDDGVGQAPGAPWRDETGSSGASVRVDEQHAFSGARAVHVLAPKGAAYRRGYFAIHQKPVFPAAASEMYGRAMMWLDAAPITPSGKPDVHWTFVQGEGRSRDDSFNSLYRYGGQHQQGLGLMANFETTPPKHTDCWQHSAAQLPVQRWACVEWHFAVANNEMEFWLDGNELSDLRVVDHGSGPESGCLGDDLQGRWLAPPAFQSLYLGWERYQEPENDQNLWIDEVVVSQQRVGCPAASPAQR